MSVDTTLDLLNFLLELVTLNLHLLMVVLGLAQFLFYCFNLFVRILFHNLVSHQA
jgi:hypothetical protein